MRANIASNFEVTSNSTTLGALPDILNETLNCGNVCDGDNFTGNRGAKAIPINDRQKATSMTENEDSCFIKNPELKNQFLVLNS
jgi:hypothetical protein